MIPVSRPRGFWIVAALLIFAVYAAVSLATHQRRREPPPEWTGPSSPAADRLYLRNVAYASYHGSEKVFSLEADDILHRKRKIGPLTMNPVKEVEMKGVRIRIYRSDPAGGGDGPGPIGDRPEAEGIDLSIGSILREAMTAKDLGFVSRVVIRPLHLTFFRGGEEAFSIAAGAASIGLEPDVLRFDHGFTLNERGGGQLVATSAEWRSDSRRLVVDGLYERRDAEGSRHGKRATFRIEPAGVLTEEADLP